MKNRTWVILGATSIIAEQFAHLAAKNGYDLLLVARDLEQLNIISADLCLRYKVNCEFIVADFSADLDCLLQRLNAREEEFDLFFAYSLIFENSVLTQQNLAELLQVNVISISQLIHAYLQKPQTNYQLVFLSSVAACRGRAKNSLYGGSKAAIETYLEGLQQAANKNTKILIARLGFIDSRQTYNSEGIFYASPPAACAKACWQASYAGKRLIYHPFFWRYIMLVIRKLPFFLYQKMKDR